MKFGSSMIILIGWIIFASVGYSLETEIQNFPESKDDISKLCENNKDSDVAVVCSQIDTLKNKIVSLEKRLQDKSPFPWSENVKFLKNSIVAVLPTTDQQCHFDWNTFSCSPLCSCEWKPKFGDISLDRACRLRTENISDCSMVVAENGPDMVFPRKFLLDMKERVNKLALKLVDNAPYSDDICHWSFKTLSCVPSPICEFNYHLGDYSLNRACRIITDREFSSEEIQYAMLST